MKLGAKLFLLVLCVASISRILMAFSLKTFTDNIIFDQNIIKFIVLDTLCSFGLVFFVTHQYIVAPIKKLRGELDAISQNKNNENRVTVEGDVEIADLGKKINQTLESINQQQQLINRKSSLSAVGEMAASIAHEINNPLTIISGYATRIRNQAEAEKPNMALIGEYTKKVQATVYRIEKIIKSLRSISRNGEEDPTTPTPVGNIVDDVYFLSQMTLKNKSITLDVSDVDPNLMIDVRSVQISQVLINLINNSVDAIELLENPYIKISTEETYNNVIISVSDSGQIKEEVADKIMNPFFTTKEIGKGTGLGLSISKNIIESHGGQFYLDRKAHNTCFKLVFPKKKAALKAA